jgi:arginase family enzyme
MAISGTKPGVWPDGVNPSRLAGCLHTEVNIDTKIALLGVPDDTGVRMNNGRPGAILGPTAFRAALARYGKSEPAGFAWPGVYDAGDVHTGDSLQETHDRVTAVVGALLAEDLLPVMIGGGHDLTFPFVRAVAAEVGKPMHGVYFDAHLDVRAEEGSGMPFRRLVEDCGVRELHVHGMDEMANTAEHLSWFQGHGGRGAHPGGGRSGPMIPGRTVSCS